MLCPKDKAYRQMTKAVYLTEAQVGAVADALAASGLPAVSAYEVGKAIFLKASEQSQRDKAVFHGMLEHLLTVRLLTRLPLQGGAEGYLLFGQGHARAQDIACSLDPFAYVSHLSAMEYHGLTDRFPKIVFMSTPPATNWRQQAREKMHKDLGERYEEYIALGLPRLTRLNLTRIGQSSIQFHERSQFGAFRHVQGTPLRVATIGRVFLDMLREPSLCGGIQHVIDIYEAEAKRHLRAIVDEVERHGKPIDKVRAGYLLTEVCRLHHPVIDTWLDYAQRGGSRKLDPEGEYLPTFSERWMLSINVPSLTTDQGGDGE
jgi:predicted transcriptional regulator of viral defense system